MVSKMLNSERHISNKREQTGKFTKPTYLLKLTEQSQTAKVGYLKIGWQKLDAKLQTNL